MTCSPLATSQLKGSNTHDQTDLPCHPPLARADGAETRNPGDRRERAPERGHMHVGRHGRVKQWRGACVSLLVVWQELLDAWRRRGSITEQSVCLRRKTTVLTRRNYYTYPVNLLGPVPKHLSAFYINETERFGHLFMDKYHFILLIWKKRNTNEWNKQSERERERERGTRWDLRDTCKLELKIEDILFRLRSI